METIADIVREIREKNPVEEYPAEYGHGEVPNMMRQLADRIEAAAKRTITTDDSKALVNALDEVARLRSKLRSRMGELWEGSEVK